MFCTKYSTYIGDIHHSSDALIFVFVYSISLNVSSKKPIVKQKLSKGGGLPFKILPIYSALNV